MAFSKLQFFGQKPFEAINTKLYTCFYLQTMDWLRTMHDLPREIFKDISSENSITTQKRLCPIVLFSSSYITLQKVKQGVK